MGEHKYNPTAIAAKAGKIPPKSAFRKRRKSWIKRATEYLKKRGCI